MRWAYCSEEEAMVVNFYEVFPVPARNVFVDRAGLTVNVNGELVSVSWAELIDWSEAGQFLRLIVQRRAYRRLIANTKYVARQSP